MTRRAPKRWSFELTLAAGMVSWTLLSDAGAQIDWKKDWERSLQEASVVSLTLLYIWRFWS